jgi:hypothetical protein
VLLNHDAALAVAGIASRPPERFLHPVGARLRANREFCYEIVLLVVFWQVSSGVVLLQERTKDLA